ncbi:hypothetical protein SAMN06265365_14024 [Tistlia consotensis]|uniref:HAMP domain-containing protein n=1 Tax=Tistlia consotensis USBA 355 TaxID=560819 RepID=A0A1Y6CUZ7_9PROT|nr:hypothetical protein [Tistlia consotensis]SMF81250.1 hypothetical protein SAMN05428998_14314 [Tistlia consotensis USBA 355]SNS23184.1 hypothetical protein SAMN06265365_14024 [Tistlia consotensis]
MSIAAPSPASRLTGGGGIGLRGLVLAVVVGALAIGSSALALAALTAFQQTLLTTVDSRLAEIATSIAGNVENGLQAGVVLPQQRRLLAVMADERAQAPEISTIRLADDRGRVLFSTNEAEIGENAPPADRAAGPGVARPDLPVEKDRPAPWRRVGKTAIVFGQPLTGLFGEPLGTITVELPKAAFETQRQRFMLSLALAAAAITVIGGLVAALALALVPLPATRRLVALRRRFEALYTAAGEPRPVLPALPRNGAAIALAGRLTRFETRFSHQLERLAEREAEVRRLDETA